MLSSKKNNSPGLNPPEKVSFGENSKKTEKSESPSPDQKVKKSVNLDVNPQIFIFVNLSQFFFF